MNKRYIATPYTSEWYQESRVFGNSGYPWAAPEYTGDKEKRYSLSDLPVVSRAIDDTFMIYPLESWSNINIKEVCDAFRKVYNAYKA